MAGSVAEERVCRRSGSVEDEEDRREHGHQQRRRQKHSMTTDPVGAANSPEGAPGHVSVPA